MTGWLVDRLINDLNRSNFDVMAAFRLHLDYVNYPFSMIFWAMLQNLQLGGGVGDDVITAFQEWSKIEGLNRQLL